MKRLLAIALLVGAAGVAHAQDVHFTQAAAVPLSLSPANAGHFDPAAGDSYGNWRLSNSYRRQWAALGQPFVTGSVGFDVPVRVRQHRLGLGAWVFNDRSGMVGLNHFSARVLAAWHHRVATGFVRIGGSASFVSRSFSTNNLTFPDQFEQVSGSFNNALQTSATGFTQQSQYFNTAVGVGWSAQLRGWTPDFSLGVEHLNRPIDSFFGNTDRLPIRWQLAALPQLHYNRKLDFRPQVIYQQQSGSNQLLTGLLAAYRLNNKHQHLRTVYGGPLLRTGFGRNRDAVAGVAGVEFRYLKIGLSYDYTISSFSPALNGRGGFEITVIYSPFSPLQKIRIPCERY